MTKEEKQLLLKDLCARIPYTPLVLLDGKERCLLTGIDGEKVYLNTDSEPFDLSESSIKPYLRPMSSMTEDEKIEYLHLKQEVKKYFWIDKLLDFYLSHHLDYRGLILMGLALEAPEGMYKIK